MTDRKQRIYEAICARLLPDHRPTFEDISDELDKYAEYGVPDEQAERVVIRRRTGTLTPPPRSDPSTITAAGADRLQQALKDIRKKAAEIDRIAAWALGDT